MAQGESPFRFSPRPNRASEILWQPWSEEAFGRAQEENRPILLSLSAVWCHWCHVMDETTYSDPDIIRLINQEFIPVRVDQDVRPDINLRYNMGGWPTTAVLTPAGDVLTGGTYVPPDAMRELLGQARDYFAEHAAELGSRTTATQQLEPDPAFVAPPGEAAQEILQSIQNQFDRAYGGLGTAPKFPQVDAWECLLLRFALAGEGYAAGMTVRTLDAMAGGGLHDGVEGGFFRYCTTRQWTDPHFEKMLDDNARLLTLFLHAFQVTGDESYREVARKTAEYVKARLMLPSGLFGGSQDADETYYGLSAEERAGRPAPAVDPTAYAGPNGLMVSAFLLASALVEGALLAAYRYPGARRKPPVHDLEHLVVVGADQAELARGTVSARATSRARDWVNEPAGSMNPTRLAQVATELGAASGFAVEVWDEQRIAAERLGGILGVSAGSATPPRLVRLAYEPAGAVATVALVGKGITFDSGGLSLKPHEGMLTMKGDMGGAAAVLASVAAAAELGLPVRALGFLALAENMPSGSATRLGDVLIARNGTSIEVLNTDAEGRLVLADALSLAVEERPDAIVDVATLTGAKVIALGNDVTGVMGTSPDLVARVLAAGRAAGEPAWELPLVQEYRAQLDSEVADLRNVGTGRAAGSIMAGLFLREFVSDVPWAHLDIAGCEMAERSEGWLTKGGTGWAARTLVELLRAW